MAAVHDASEQIADYERYTRSPRVRSPRHSRTGTKPRWPSAPAETTHPLGEKPPPFARTGRANRGAAASINTTRSGASG